jgi:hypothetical protein
MYLLIRIINIIRISMLIHIINKYVSVKYDTVFYLVLFTDTCFPCEIAVALFHKITAAESLNCEFYNKSFGRRACCEVLGCIGGWLVRGKNLAFRLIHLLYSTVFRAHRHGQFFLGEYISNSHRNHCVSSSDRIITYLYLILHDCGYHRQRE